MVGRQETHLWRQTVEVVADVTVGVCTVVFVIKSRAARVVQLVSALGWGRVGRGNVLTVGVIG